jgi:phosphoribosylglycinamide formyltransferase-1
VKKRAAVLVSGSGTNLQSMLDTAAEGKMPHVEIALVISSSKTAHAIKRATRSNIPVVVLDCAEYKHDKKFELDRYDIALAATLAEHAIEVVALAGFLLRIGPKVLAAYDGRIINIHPSLLPSFGGDGCYGIHVHEKALARGVKITGATVHFVNSEIDGGKIIMQKAVDVKPEDTPDKLQRRVLTEAEWLIYPAALETVCAQIADKA